MQQNGYAYGVFPLNLLKQCVFKDERERQRMRDVPFSSAIGKLMYATVVSRPDIAFAVNKVAQFQRDPGQRHWEAVKRIFRYFQGTRTLGLLFKGNGEIEFQGYVDAAYADCIDSRRSTSGHVFIINGTAVSWSSKRLPLLTLSSTESEYDHSVRKQSVHHCSDAI